MKRGRVFIFLLSIFLVLWGLNCGAQARDQTSPPVVTIKPGLIFKLGPSNTIRIDIPGQVATYSNYDLATLQYGQTLFDCNSKGFQQVHLLVKNMFATLEFDVPIKIISSAVFDNNYPDLDLYCITTVPDFGATAHDGCSGASLPVHQDPAPGTPIAAGVTLLITLTTANADEDVEKKTFKLKSEGNVTAPNVTISAIRCDDGKITFSTPPVDGALTYQWKVNGNNTGTNNPRFSSNTLINTDVVTCTVAGNYPCTPGSAATSNSISVAVVKQNDLVPSVTIDSPPEVTFCPGTATSFAAVPVNGGLSPTFQWNINGIGTGITSNTYSSSAFNDGDILTSTMVSDLPCLDQPVTSAPIILNSSLVKLPVLNIISSATGPVCSGVPLTFTASYNGPANKNYQWRVNGINTGTNSAAFTTAELKNSDKIECEVTTTGSCVIITKSNTITAQITAPPEITFTGDVRILPGESVRLNPFVTGDIASYQWQLADGLTDAAVRNPNVKPVNTVTYHLHTVSTLGCEGDGSVTVFVIRDVIPPNTFTPNNDGINDTWAIKNLSGYPKCNVDVYNRYGQRIYHSVGYGSAWDGTLNGKQIPSGTYYYVIDLKNNKPLISGAVTVLR